METFYDISVYLGCLPVGMGIYFWYFLKHHVKVYLINNIILQCFALASITMSYIHQNTHFLYYINNILTIIMYSLFYQSTLKLESKYLLLIPFFIGIFMYIDFYKNGIREYFVIPMLLIEISILPFAIILYRKNIIDKTLKLLNIAIIIYASVDIIINLMSFIFYHYFQGKAFDLIFLGILPLNVLCLNAFQTYAFSLASKQTQPSFDNNPNFR